MKLCIFKCGIKSFCFIAFQVFFVILTALFLLSYGINSLAPLLEGSIAAPLRGVMSYLASSLPLPTFELFILFSPILIMLAIRKCTKMKVKTAISTILIFAQSMILCYEITLGIPSVGAAEKSHRVEDVTAEELIFAADRLAFMISEYEGDGITDANEVLALSANAAKSLALWDSLNVCVVPRVKRSVIPELLTEANILAYYSFLTSEIIINGNQPLHMYAYTAAHELSHYFGITREDEANLFAFRALISSDDGYLRYCAALGAYEYLAAPLYSESKETYSANFSKLGDFAKRDILRANSFLKSLGGGVVGKLSDAANDKMLLFRDERGAESYSDTANILASYIASYCDFFCM